MDELTFWRECCERGISICQIPKPMKEDAVSWLVVKQPTFKDRRNWAASYTFDCLDDVYREVSRYLESGVEPVPTPS